MEMSTKDREKGPLWKMLISHQTLSVSEKQKSSGLPNGA